MFSFGASNKEIKEIQIMIERVEFEIMNERGILRLDLLFSLLLVNFLLFF